MRWHRNRSNDVVTPEQGPTETSLPWAPISAGIPDSTPEPAPPVPLPETMDEDNPARRSVFGGLRGKRDAEDVPDEAETQVFTAIEAAEAEALIDEETPSTEFDDVQDAFAASEQPVEAPQWVAMQPVAEAPVEAPVESVPVESAPAEPTPVTPPPPVEVSVPQVELGISFGERIERMIAAAMQEAEATKVQAERDADATRNDARLAAEHTVAAAQRQAAETIAQTQARCEDEVAATQRARQEADYALTEARHESEQILRRARDEVTELRQEIDRHAQSMLARTHAETGRTLAAARAELEELKIRKAELEEQMAAIRSMLSGAVTTPLSDQMSGFLGHPGA